MSSVPKVTLIILTWNALAYTRRCLATLRDHTDLSVNEVIVVDNGSTDGTVRFLETLDWIRLIKNRRNLGFVKGNNVGISASDPNSDVILLNNDIEIYQRGWLEKLQAAAYSDGRIGVAGCRLVQPGGKLLHAGTYMPLNSFWGQQIGSGEKDVNQYNQTREVEGVVFACVYIKRAVLEAVGPLDESYVSYFEDSDYCLMAREKGYTTVCCGDVTLVHHERVSTTENRADFSSIFERSQHVFKKRWKASLESRYTAAVGWQSIMNVPTGYAMTCRQVLVALEEAGIKVAYQYAYGDGTPYPVQESPDAGDYLLNMIRARPLDSEAPQVTYAQGDVFQRNTGRYKIGFTMTEVDGFPEEWVTQASRMDEIWVPSTCSKEGFIASGLRKPIYVIPLGVNPAYFNPGITGYPLGGQYAFLSIFDWRRRKGADLLLPAFNNEFRAHEDVVLICKVTAGVSARDLKRELAALQLCRDGGRIYFLINQFIPYYQLGALYRSADCFVLPTRGEGWGMPLLEAMACGLPVIATNWGGHTEFMTEHNAYPVHVETFAPADESWPYYKGFRWAEPDGSHLRYLMRYVFEHRDEAKDVGRRASQEVRRDWTWSHSAGRIRSRLAEIGAMAQMG